MTGVPVLYYSNRNSKDANYDFKITYTWDRNNPQQTGNVIKIYDNETNNLVYDETLTNYYKPECTVPANTLLNGKLYKVTVSVICSEGTSIPSEPVLFYCYTSPSLAFRNLVQDQLIQSDTYKVELLYSQPEGEELEDYFVRLYSSEKAVIYTSSVRYDTDNLFINISGMENNTQYYFKAFGKTITGMDIETDYVLVTIRYLQPTIYSLVELNNNYHGGYVTIKSNILSLRARVYRDGEEVDPSYIDGKFIDLRDPNTILKFEENYSVPPFFTIELRGCSFVQNSAPLVLSDGEHKSFVYYRKGNFVGSDNQEKAYFEFRIVDELIYTIVSNYIEIPSENELVGFQLTRRNNNYSLIACNYGEVVESL